MLREYDVVHVYNLEMGVDYQAILVALHDDGTVLVRSEITGNEYTVEISDLHKIDEAQQSFAPDSLKAGDSCPPESVKVENVLPAVSG